MTSILENSKMPRSIDPIKIKRKGPVVLIITSVMWLFLSALQLCLGNSNVYILFIIIFLLNIYLGIRSIRHSIIEISPVGIRNNGLLIATMDECISANLSGNSLLLECKNRNENISIFDVSRKDRALATETINHFLTSRCTGADYG